MSGDVPPKDAGEDVPDRARDGDVAWCGRQPASGDSSFTLALPDVPTRHAGCDPEPRINNAGGCCSPKSGAGLIDTSIGPLVVASVVGPFAIEHGGEPGAGLIAMMELHSIRASRGWVANARAVLSAQSVHQSLVYVGRQTADLPEPMDSTLNIGLADSVNVHVSLPNARALALANQALRFVLFAAQMNSTSGFGNGDDVFEDLAGIGKMGDQREGGLGNRFGIGVSVPRTSAAVDGEKELWEELPRFRSEGMPVLIVRGPPAGAAKLHVVVLVAGFQGGFKTSSPVCDGKTLHNSLDVSGITNDGSVVTSNDAASGNWLGEERVEGGETRVVALQETSRLRKAAEGILNASHAHAAVAASGGGFPARDCVSSFVLDAAARVAVCGVVGLEDAHGFRWRAGEVEDPESEVIGGPADAGVESNTVGVDKRMGAGYGVEGVSEPLVVGGCVHAWCVGDAPTRATIDFAGTHSF